MKEFKVLQQIADTAGKNAKMAILASCDTPAMRTILYLTLNKFLTYRVQQIDLPDRFNDYQPDIIDPLEQLLMDLARHQTGTYEAKRMIRLLLARCTEFNASWIVKVIQRDLNMGIDVSSVNKVFPLLVPTFSVQLANKVEDLGSLVYPLVIEEKLDGMRSIAVVKDGVVTFYSREGRELGNNNNLKCIADDILKLRPGTDYVIDGELIAFKFNAKNKVAVKNKLGNWKFSQALSMLKNQDTTAEEIAEFIGLYAWDVIDINYFLSQGAKGQAKTLTGRKYELEALFSRNKLDLKNLFMVPNVMCLNKEAVLGIFRQIRAQNGEGIMAKKPDGLYSFKRNDNILKLKEFYQLDLRVIGCREGTSKYEGMLGNLIVASDCGAVKTMVGSGFTDEDRMEMWLRHLNGELEGIIVEVCYQEKTVDGALRFPTFVCERYDKTTTSLV